LSSRGPQLIDSAAQEEGHVSRPSQGAAEPPVVAADFTEPDDAASDADSAKQAEGGSGRGRTGLLQRLIGLGGGSSKQPPHMPSTS
jgi:hypothetical protein